MAAFAENCIDGRSLVKLTKEELRELGVAAMGHRNRIFEVVQAATPPPAEAPRAPTPALHPALTILVAFKYANLDVGRALGRGGFAVVYNAQHRPSGTRFALKVPLPHRRRGRSLTAARADGASKSDGLSVRLGSAARSSVLPRGAANYGASARR